MSPNTSSRSPFPFFAAISLALLAIALPGCLTPAWSPPGGYYGGGGAYGGRGPTYYPGGYGNYGGYGGYAPPRRVYVPVYRDDDDDDDHHHNGDRYNNGWRGRNQQNYGNSQRDQQRARQYDAEQLQRSQRYEAEQQQRAQRYDAEQQQRSQQYEARLRQQELARKQKEQRDEERRQQQAQQQQQQTQAPQSPWPPNSRPQPGVRGVGHRAPADWKQSGPE